MPVRAVNGSEEQRLVALHRLGILDTPPEPEFDELVKIAAAICGTPIGVVSFLDDHRQWFKATVGLEMQETPREIAFCNHTIQQPGLLQVADAAEDERFANSPLVTGEMGVRFYAGVPVTDPTGQPIGSLCVIDRVPRTLSEEQSNALRLLAAQVVDRLALRAQRQLLEKALFQAEIANAKLEKSEQRFQIFMDSAPVLGYLKDGDGRMLYYNQAFAKHFEVSREFLLNKSDGELWPPDIAATYRQHDLEVLRSGELRITQEQSKNPDGSVSFWRSYKFPCPDLNGRTFLGGFSVEISADLRRERELAHYRLELEDANRQLRKLASLDPLTGLANRRSFDEQSGAAFSRARRSGGQLSVLLLDVDNFKKHNDVFGHTHGDQVLRDLAQCLRTDLRDGDLLARYGGEEFCILLPETGEGGAALLAQRLLKTVRNFPWAMAPVTISIGISSLDAATPDMVRLVTLADEALYAAKHAGKDQAVRYSFVYQQVLHEARQRRA